MPIPNEGERRDVEMIIERRLCYPPGWKVSLSVKPWLGHDMGYEVDEKARTVFVEVYSATYPRGLKWMDAVCIEIREKMKWNKKDV